MQRPTRKHRHSIRPIEIDGDIARITLTKGQVSIIDAADVPLVEGVNWMALWNGSAWYAVRHTNIGGKHKGYLLHRVLTGCPDGSEVDHVNRDSLDNRRVNLRICTRSQNNANSVSRNKHGLKGVCFHKPSGRWNARIKLDRITRSLGYFNTKEEAGAAYATAAKILFGEFALPECALPAGA